MGKTNYDYIPKLPYGWNPQTVVTLPEYATDGKYKCWKLQYPTTLNYLGQEVKVNSYEEHYYFIQKLFKPKRHAANS